MMSNLRYPSDLQRRYANTVFPTLSDEAIITILAEADDDTFTNLCQSEEFKSYCGTNSIFSERLYEERARRAVLRRFNEDILEFKPIDMKWREFYRRMMIFIYKLENENQSPRDFIVARGRKVERLMELQIFYRLTGRLPTRKDADRAAENGFLNTLEWLYEKGVSPTIEGAVAASRLGRLELLKWLYKIGVRFDRRVAVVAWNFERREVVHWLATIGIQV